MRIKAVVSFVILGNIFCGCFAYAKQDPVYDCQENVVYAIDHGIGLILDVYTPKGEKNGRGIIFVMNGSYYSNAFIQEAFHNQYKIYDNFCSKGYTVFSIRPGSFTKFTIDEMTVNLKTGIRWVKAHAADYNVDAERLGLTGASSGANLALLTMVHQEPGSPNEQDPLKKHSTRICAAGLFFPPTDWLDKKGELPAESRQWLGKFAFMCGFGDLSEEEILAKAIYLSPARQVKTILPPVILYHGDIDVIPIAHSKKMVNAILKAGGQAELVTVKGRGHSWLGIDKEVGQIADWFDKQLVQK